MMGDPTPKCFWPQAPWRRTTCQTTSLCRSTLWPLTSSTCSRSRCSTASSTASSAFLCCLLSCASSHQSGVGSLSVACSSYSSCLLICMCNVQQRLLIALLSKQDRTKLVEVFSNSKLSSCPSLCCEQNPHAFHKPSSRSEALCKGAVGTLYVTALSHEFANRPGSQNL